MEVRKHRQQPPSIIEDKSIRHGHIKKYKLLSHLGKGGFANVYRVQSLDSSKIYACKIINKSKLVQREHRRKLISEIKLHSSLEHEHIIKFERHFEDTKNVYILLECIPNKSLMELSIKRHKLTEHEVRYFMLQILIAIKYLHEKGIIHRDLKLGNILLDKGLNIKICDFGLAAKLECDSDRKTTICGTPNYTAPEILNQRKSGLGHSYEVDIWSIGVIMFTLLTGKPPFETKNIKETYRRIKKIKYEFPINSDQYISSDARHLISQIFTKEPTKRPNLFQITNHSFFKKAAISKSLPSFILTRAPTRKELFPLGNDQNDKGAMSTRAPLISTGYQSKTTLNGNYHSMKYNQNNNNMKSTQNKEENDQEKDKENKDCLQSQFERMNEKHGDDDDHEMSSNDSELLMIVKHIDYTKKYGTGYILSNGCTGIYFNDSTKILLSENKENVTYIDNEEKQQHFPMRTYPSGFKKKVTLLQHFRNYLWKQSEDKTLEQEVTKRLKEWTVFNDEERIYVKTSVSDEYCILFKLSNNTVQVNFTDKSRIIMKENIVFYRDKLGNENVMKKNSIADGDRNDLKKRCQYTQQLLQKISNKQF